MNATSAEVLTIIAGPVAESVGSVVAPFMQWISVGIGGLFGLYTIYFIIKIVMDRHRLKILHEVKDEIMALEERLPSKKEIQELTTLLKKQQRKTSSKKK